MEYEWPADHAIHRNSAMNNTNTDEITTEMLVNWDAPNEFPGGHSVILYFGPDEKKACDAYGTRKANKSYDLRNRVRHDLCQYMIRNHYFHGIDRPCNSTLDGFYDLYRLRDPNKNLRAKTFFINEINSWAGVFTSQVYEDQGINVRNRGMSTGTVGVLEYKRGYEYLLNVDLRDWLGEGWLEAQLDGERKGEMRSEFFEVAEVKNAVRYSLQDQLCTEDDLFELHKELTQELEQRKKGTIREGQSYDFSTLINILIPQPTSSFNQPVAKKRDAGLAEIQRAIRYRSIARLYTDEEVRDLHSFFAKKLEKARMKEKEASKDLTKRTRSDAKEGSG